MKRTNEFSDLVKENACQVFLMRCPTSLPLSFAPHHWLVINDHGTLSRYEVLFRENRRATRWGHIYKDFFKPFEGVEIIPFYGRFLWRAKLAGIVEGDIAKRMAAHIEQSPFTYPGREEYVITGPNSNTYVEWILEQSPGAKLSLPWNAFGRDYDVKAHPSYPPRHEGPRN